jgi:glycosyltransferase involved in cell wall biosynthesis
VKPINILQFICPSGFYGAEMWVLALAKNLETGRVDCRLAITRESETQNIELYKRFCALGLKAYQIRMKGRFDPIGILRIVNLIKCEKINIIHSHGYKSDILGLIAARLAGVKIVVTPHGFENAPDRKLRLFIRMGGIALRHCDMVAPLSEELESDILKLGVAPGRTKLIINGVDLNEVESEREVPTPSPWPADGEKRIGYIGQISHRKNIGDIIQAFDRLYREHKDTRLVLIGDGAQRSSLEEMSRSLPSSSQIEFLGYRSDRLRLLKHFDLFTMTSSLEGIPRCLMEAMAMGVPVAAYDIPGVDKLVIHEKTGLLSRFGDVEGLKQQWERLLFDGGISTRITQDARQYVYEHFSAKRMAEEYTSLYQELFEKRYNGGRKH